MQINTPNKSLNYILLRKNGDKLSEMQNNEKLPFITLTSKNTHKNTLTRNYYSNPFISSIDENTSSNLKENKFTMIDNIPSFTYKINLKNNKTKNFKIIFNNNENYNKIIDNDNITSSSFNEIHPCFKNKNNFENKNNYKSSVYTSTTEDKLFDKQINTINSIPSNNSNKKKFKLINNILKNNKKFLLDEYLLTHKKENYKGCFSKSERKCLLNKNYSEEKKKFPLLFKDICTEKLIIKNKEINNNKIKLAPYILNERYKNNKLGSSLDKLNYTKKVNLKGDFKIKNNNINFKGGQTRNLFLLGFINRKFNSFKSLNNYK